jgi:hypothetical protein
MPPRLNWTLAWIATIAGVLEIAFFLPRTILVSAAIVATALITWALLHRFGVPDRITKQAAERQRRNLGY